MFTLMAILIPCTGHAGFHVSFMYAVLCSCSHPQENRTKKKKEKKDRNTKSYEWRVNSTLSLLLRMVFIIIIFLDNFATPFNISLHGALMKLT